MKVINFILALVNLFGVYTLQRTATFYNNELVFVRKLTAPPQEVTVKPKKKKLARTVYAKPKKLDWNIAESLQAALAAYTGPPVTITSLRRYNNPRSAHYTGHAADFAAQNDFIAYLMSEEGKQWLTTFNLDYYIEDKYNSAFIKRFAHTDKTLINKRATGSHIHLYVRKGVGRNSISQPQPDSARHRDDTTTSGADDVMSP